MASADRPTVEILVADVLDDRAVRRNRVVLDDALTLRPRHLVFDLRRCRLITDAGIDLLLDTERRLRDDGGRLSVLRVSAQVRDTLLRSQLTHLLESDPPPPGYRPRHRRSRRRPHRPGTTSVDELRWWSSPAPT